MTRTQVAEAMAQLMFTAAREWRRVIVIDRTVRDLIVQALRR